MSSFAVIVSVVHVPDDTTGDDITSEHRLAAKEGDRYGTKLPDASEQDIIILSGMSNAGAVYDKLSKVLDEVSP